MYLLQFNYTDTIDYNTFKTYTKEQKKEGLKLGVKLVRGAYMEKERARAEKLGYHSPIQPNKESTDKDYDEAIKFCLDNLDVFEILLELITLKARFCLCEEMEKTWN